MAMEALRFRDAVGRSVLGVRARLGAAIVAAGIALAATAWPGATAVAVARAPVAPSHAAIAAILARAVEVAAGERADCAKGCEHLHLFGRVVVVPDGHGGWLTAVPTVRWPTADGYGQLVLFWHDRTFVGSDALTALPDLGQEAVSVGVAAGPDGSVVLRFARYRPSDPMCCPTLRPVSIAYRWDGRRLVASAPVPKTALLTGMRFVLGRAR
jgi:hypothetical protein